MRIAKRKEEILRIKSARFHPQMSETLEKEIRANVIFNSPKHIRACFGGR